MTKEQIEEAAEKYAYKGIDDEFKPMVEGVAKYLIDAFKEGVNWAFQNQRISVDEELPEKEESCQQLLQKLQDERKQLKEEAKQATTEQEREHIHNLILDNESETNIIKDELII